MGKAVPFDREHVWSRSPRNERETGALRESVRVASLNFTNESFDQGEDRLHF